MKIGVLGTGHLGKIHIKCIKLIPEYDFVAIYDPIQATREKVAKELDVIAYDSVEDLIDAVDVVDIVTPTTYHFELAKLAIEKGKHVFIEKPVTNTVEEAEILLQLAKENQVKVQVGHVERFNPALQAIENITLNPMFIEVHRLATFNPRGTDVSVVLDLMIHDLDIILHFVKSPVKSVHASGVSIVSSKPDIANVRLEFENGCVANVTSSRLSLKQMRKVRLFQKDAYISMDMLEKKTEVVRLHEQGDLSEEQRENMMKLDTQNGSKFIELAMPETKPTNAIKQELDTFRKAILNDGTPTVTLKDGYEALKVAHLIMQDIEKRYASLVS